MKDFRRSLSASLLVGFASLINLGLLSGGFRVSAGIILFVALLYYYDDLEPIPTGILSGVIVYLLRVMVFFVSNQGFGDAFTAFLPEILFYISYAIVYHFAIYRRDKNNLNLFYFIMVISDLGANYAEVSLRSIMESSLFTANTAITLIIVSVIRSAIIWLILNGIVNFRGYLSKFEKNRIND
ncbi:hypothetical protein E9840_06150 [Tissierella creatinini]|nr:hypothetical protein E9840_06150 [Tissierella creatinini]TJX63770.1 hypothetical protein E8P77_14475 [Soehngenia saccharolytica]